MLNPIKIGNRIKADRIKNGISQEDLAERLYVTRQAVSKWEMGQTLPSIDNICLLAELFDTSIEDILCMERETPLSRDSADRLSGKFVVGAVSRGEIDFDISEKLDSFAYEERTAIIKSVKGFLNAGAKNPLTNNLNLQSFWLKLNDEEKQLFNLNLYKEEVKNAYRYFSHILGSE